MNKKHIKRDELQYIEVENFKDYELTNNISFEMAIRNKSILDLYTQFNLAWYSMGDYSKYYNFSDEEIRQSLKVQCDAEQILKTEYFIFAFDANALLALYNFSRLYNPNVTSEYAKKNYTNISSNINYKNEIICNSQIIDNVSILSTTTKINDILLEKDAPNPFFYTEVNLQETDTLLENVTHNANILTKRNMMLIPNHFTKEVKLNLNLSLPLHELLSCVEHIHTTFNKNQIKITPIEQLGIKLEKASTCISYKKPRGKLEDIDATKYLKFQYKLANMLYIYDAYKIGMKQKDIQHELSYYNGNTTVDTAIINEMHAIAKEYIDNLKYKELITGVQQE